MMIDDGDDTNEKWKSLYSLGQASCLQKGPGFQAPGPFLYFAATAIKVL